MVDIVDSDSSLTSNELDALADEIATFAARIDVAEHALLTRLRVFDAHEAWGFAGFLSCAHWLSWRIGVGIKAARDKVRVARALGELPRTDALFGEGKLSYSKVRAITRIATPASEQELVDIALHATASQLEQLTASVRRSLDLADPDRQPTDEQRFVRRIGTPGGMMRIEIQLPVEEAAVLWEAIGAATEAPAKASAEASAEALTVPNPEQSRADAIVDVARTYLKDQSSSRGSAYELVLVTSSEQLASTDGHVGGGSKVGGFLRDGTPVPLHIAQMLACDSARVDVSIGEHGELLDVGRSTRSIPPAIGRALWLRDGGCRMPGCGRKRHLHAHHIHAWARGGPTKLGNLVLGTIRAEVRAAKFVFTAARGELANAPAARVNGHDLEELERFIRQADVHLDPSVNAPLWDGTPMDLVDSVAWMWVAEQTRATTAQQP